MENQELTGRIIGAAITVQQTPDSDFFEKVYLAQLVVVCLSWNQEGITPKYFSYRP
jgi:hypothetical protein